MANCGKGNSERENCEKVNSEKENSEMVCLENCTVHSFIYSTKLSHLHEQPLWCSGSVSASNPLGLGFNDCPRCIITFILHYTLEKIGL